MADDSDLTTEQTDQLICFQEITQIESIDECKRILEAFSWNVESAIQNSFNEKERHETQATNASSNLLSSQSFSHSSLNTSTAMNDFNEATFNHFHEPHANIPTVSNYQRTMRPSASSQAQALPNVSLMSQRTLSYYGSPQGSSISEGTVVPRGLLQWGYFLVAFPFKLILSTLVDIASVFWSFFESASIPSDYDPLANIAEFVIQYNTEFGTDHVDFYQGSYSQAVSEAKRELKFLVVYLHQTDNQDCIKFATESMTNPDLIEYLRANVIFWACSKNLPEGQKVYNALKARRCPFLGLIVYKGSRMTLVSKIEGPISAPELLVQLAQLMSDNEADLVVARADKEERNMTRTIRQEQDQAYEQSLQADREKARLKKEQEEARLNAEKLEKQRIEDEVARENAIIEKRAALRKLLAETAEPNPSNEETVKLLIKLPNGNRHQRIFRRQDPLSELYKFVYAQEDCPRSFEIAINFPHKVVECDEETTLSIHDFGITQSMLLFVNDLEA